MSRLSALLIAFGLGVSIAIGLVSCGGGSDADLLPGTTADQIEANLEEVRELAAAEDCIGAEDAVATVTADVEELEGVDLKLKAALQEGTEKLSEVVGHCEEETTSEEAEPELETDVEPEVEEKKKPKKDTEEPAEPEEGPTEEEGGELPPQSNGKGEEKGGAEPPAEPAEE